MKAPFQSGPSFERNRPFSLKAPWALKAPFQSGRFFLAGVEETARATQILNVSNPTARQAIALFQGEGLLVEMTGHSWRRIYLARPILEAIEDRS